MGASEQTNATNEKDNKNTPGCVNPYLQNGSSLFAEIVLKGCPRRRFQKCFVFSAEATIKDMIVLYMKNKLKTLLVVVGKEDFTSL